MSGSNSADQSWAQQDKRRILVLDVRVQNIEHTQQFYEQHLGMKIWRRLGDLLQGQFTSICGYGQSYAYFHGDVPTACITSYRSKDTLSIHVVAVIFNGV